MANRPTGTPPVPLKTRTNVRKFLDVLASTGNATKAAKAIGVTKGACDYWRRKDPKFAEAWQDALDEALDTLEETARDRALRGARLESVTKLGDVVEYQGAPSDQMAKFLLTVHRYREKGVKQHEHTHKHMVNLSDAQLEAIAAKASGILGEHVVDSDTKLLETSEDADSLVRAAASILGDRNE